MSIAIKNEFYRWIESLDTKTLSEIDCKFLNLLLLNFDAILPLTTAGGSRARKIADLIHKKNVSLPNTLSIDKNNSADSTDKAQIIGSLKIGPFRGFSRSESFKFDKKFTFMYGPNGSGKSSFCEGLEYALLGEIEEANAKRIPVDQYIKNEQAGIGIEPNVFKIDDKTLISKSQAYYRFAFIEKNRIDGFARIAATTSSIQKDRIAVLFGLEAFSSFVDGFTDNISKYLTLSNEIKESFTKELQKDTENKDKIGTNNTKLKKIEDDILNLIKGSGQEGIKKLEELVVFLSGSDNISGYLSDLRKKESQQIPNDIKLDKIKSIVADISKGSEGLKELKEYLSELVQLSTNVNYKELFSAILKLRQGDEIDIKICPACKTPLSNTKVNPFDNAITELDNLKSLSILQTNVETLGKFLSENSKKLNSNIISINASCQYTNYSGTHLPIITDFVFTDIHNIETWLPQFELELSTIQDNFKNIRSIETHLIKYNEGLSEKRVSQSNIAEEIKKYTDMYTRCIEIETTRKRLIEENKTLQAAINDFTKTNSPKLKAIDDEDKKIAIHQKFADSYLKLISALKVYRNQMPSKYSKGLSAKAKEYYNMINAHDPDFEKLDTLVLPVMSDNKVEIQFNGDTKKHDALNILSEGHIKVLGLSILLAKAENENLGFLIFDDIVNAIDDDHRDGVAELLMCHEDINQRQIIITCHGETFINKLEHKLGSSEASKNVKNIKFIPIDIVQERGVQVSIGNSKHYLLKAEEYWEDNKLKDSATECRRAVESISTKLWKKLDKRLKINLKVTMRSPGSAPDLYTVVNSLLVELKKVSGTDDLCDKITVLKTKYEWSLLNKGVHEDDKQPEFERNDIKELVDLIKDIEKMVESIKLGVVA